MFLDAWDYLPKILAPNVSTGNVDSKNLTERCMIIGYPRKKYKIWGMVRDKKYSVALSLIDQLGNQTYKRLIDFFGSAKEVFKAPLTFLTKKGKLQPKLANIIIKERNTLLEKAHRVILNHKKKGCHIITYEDNHYPNHLRHTYSPPPVLYLSRDFNLNRRRCIAIVGTRSASSYGKNFAHKMVKELAPYGITVVSGLAYGIDIQAHEAALQAQLPTIAVLAGGINRVYPFDHQQQAETISKRGCLISEEPLDVRPSKHHFPIRNRIIAGLSDVVVIVEAGIKSGALITAKYANDFNREVTALPGNIGNKQSEGCHHLIKTHQAHLLTGAEDIAYLMNWKKVTAEEEDDVVTPIPMKDLCEEERTVVQKLQQSNMMTLENLSDTTRIALPILTTMMMELEMKQVVAPQGGGKYALVA